MNKYAFFAFKGELMCFVHVLINAIDMNKKGMDVKIIIEGEAVKLVKELQESGNQLYVKVKDMGLIDCICKACSAKMGVLEYNEKTGISMGDEMNGHPSMASYIGQGYQIITL